MKILVVSDSHGDFDTLRRILLANQKCDIFIHCGDSELPSSYMPFELLAVKGNCDYFDDYPLKRDIKTKFGTIHVEHGNLFSALTYSYISSLNCYIYLFGHTHERCAKKVDNTYIFNPGSLTEPRDSSLGSYLIIEINDESGELNYKFYDVEL